MKKSVKILWYVFLTGIGSVVLLFLLANFGLLGSMPSIAELENPTASLASQVYAEDGTLMGKYYLEDRVNVGFKDISKHVINALVATEDERFYDHNGVDPRALGRAVFSLGSGGGASTITMQTAKNLFTENWGTQNKVKRVVQKIKESIIAIKLERNFTKDEIITLYLNTVPYGDNIYGIRNAAKTFFQKEPDRLSVEEAAMLVGMLKGGIYNPRRFPKQAMDRRNTVLNQMVRNSFLSAAEADGLKKKPIRLNYKKMDETAGIAPYFRMILGEDMKKWCKEHKKPGGGNYNLYKDGLKIYTTINPIMQQYAEEALAKHYSSMQKVLSAQSDIKSGAVWKGHDNILEAAMKQTDRWKAAEKEEGASAAEIRKSFFVKTPMRVFAWNTNRSIDTVMTPFDSIKYHKQMLQAGFMAMDPLRGDIKAWVGGIDFKTFKYDHVNINTKRQVGSTMKPLLYSLAIEQNGFTPGTTVEDVQQSFGSYGQVPATTASCSGASMPMWKALALSKNCATAYIMKQLGPQGNDGAKRFVEFLKECNVQTDVQPFPSIALGSAEISLYEMMQAYSMFPGRGFNVKPMYITRIEDRNGNVLQTFIPERKEVISDVTAYNVVEMMQGVMKFGTGRRMWSYDVSGEIAGKTGTTNDNSDAWFMGYTPQLIGGVWTGCDDRFIRFSSTAMGQGSSVALPVWAYFYNKVSNDKSLSIDTKATFVKPEAMTNESFNSWESTNTLPNEVEGGTNGSATDYGDDGLPPPTPENIGGESKPPANDNNNPSPTGAKPPVDNKPKPAPGNKPAGPATTPPPATPKAVLPKKVTK